MIGRHDKGESVFLEKKDNHLDRRTLRILLIGIFLISFAELAFEINLIRILSVVLSYHYVFLVASLALLGLGAGGIFVHLFRPQESGRRGRFGFLGIFPILFALSIPFSVMLITQIASLENFLGNVLSYCFLLFIPFFLVGILLAEIFRAFPTLSSRIYGMDLLGAAAGSLGIVFILNSIGGINRSFLLASVAATAALLIAMRVHGKNVKVVTISIVSFVTIVSLLGTNLIGAYLPEVPVGTNPAKEIHNPLHESSYQGEIIETKWSAFGRTDLIASDNVPDVMGIFIDGTAGSPMYQFNGDFDNPNPMVDSLKTDFPGYFPFFFLQEEERDSALIIGPGGGRDILLAEMGGVGNITAVEVNQEAVDIVREYAWHNGGIYTDLDNVTVIVDEGRNFLKRQKEKYDIIMLSIPIIKTSRSPEGYALTENFLLTTDSISDYLEHLTDEGRLIVVAHDSFETLRLLSISLASFNERGISNEVAMQQIYMIVPTAFPLFVVKKTPFEPTGMLSRYEMMQQMEYTPVFFYLPGITPDMEGPPSDEHSILSSTLMAISKGEIGFSDLEGALEQGGLDVSPVTDNSPFFNKFEVGIPRSVSLILRASLIMLLLALLVPPLYWRRKLSQSGTQLGSNTGFNRNLLRFVGLFLILGVGFMLAEVSLIQKLILFLGQPVLSLAVLLFSLLAGAGIGSLYSGRLPRERLIKGVAIVCLSIVGMLLGYTFLLPIIFNQLLGLSLIVRLLATVGLLMPLGFLMGFPFPSGLRLLREMKMENYIPWMWGINGVSSVLGSAIAMVIAISLGFTEALLMAAGCYFLVFLIFHTTQPKEGLLLGHRRPK